MYSTLVKILNYPINLVFDRYISKHSKQSRSWLKQRKHLWCYNLFPQLFTVTFMFTLPFTICFTFISHSYHREDLDIWLVLTYLYILKFVSGCQYSMRLDRLHRAYPSLHPFGVVHWVPVLSNIKTATGCELNRQLQLWTVFAGTVVNNYQFNCIQGWAGQLCQISCWAVI